MKHRPTRQLSRFLAGALFVAALPLAGCIGIYDNSVQFELQPAKGLEETEVLKRYGSPEFAGYVENKQVYIYKIRDNRYYVLYGVYEGYDLVITCENGVVTDVSKVERPKAMTLFNPVPWAEAD
jgi:hypothetical protein